MIVQIFKTECEGCRKELESRTGNMTGENDIIIDFVDGMEFECDECGETTYIEVSKYTG